MLAPPSIFTSTVFPYSAAYWPISALSVSEKLVYCFRFLALCWLASFPAHASCFHLFCELQPFWSQCPFGWEDDSRTEIMVLILKKTNKQLLKKNKNYSTTFTVVILHKAGNIHCHCFSLNSHQLTFIGSMSTCSLTTPTKSHLHKFNYCDLFFAMPSALKKFAKVKFTQNIIALQYITLMKLVYTTITGFPFGSFIYNVVRSSEIDVGIVLVYLQHLKLFLKFFLHLLLFFLVFFLHPRLYTQWGQMLALITCMWCKSSLKPNHQFWILSHSFRIKSEGKPGRT